MAFRFRPGRQVCGLSLAAAVAIAASQPVLASGMNAASRDIEVLMDQAMMVRLERPAAEIVVGNPSIADVAIQSSNALVLTGKSFGETNLIVTDRDGKVIVNRRVIVQEPDGAYVTVYRGAGRETLVCAPKCETPLVIGDEKTYFDTIAKQVRTKQGIGQSSAEGDPGLE